MFTFREPIFARILDEKQRQQVEHLRKGHRDLDCAYQLSQAFALMQAERRGKDLDEWLSQAQHSGIAEFKSFAASAFVARKAESSSESA
jgi:transposase